MDLENPGASGRDKGIWDSKGTTANFLLMAMKTFEKHYFIHLLYDMCTSLASRTRSFEREEVDLSIIEPRVSDTITTLRKMKEKDAPLTSRAASVAERAEKTRKIKIQMERKNLLKKLYCV